MQGLKDCLNWTEITFVSWIESCNKWLLSIWAFQAHIFSTEILALELNCVGILWQQNTIMFKCLAKTIGQWTKANLLGYIFKKMFLLVGIFCSVDAFRHTISICLSVYLSIYLDRLVSQCIGLSVHPSVLLSIGLLVHWLVDRSVGWSVSPSVGLSVILSVGQ